MPPQISEEAEENFLMLDEPSLRKKIPTINIMLPGLKQYFLKTSSAGSPSSGFLLSLKPLGRAVLLLC